MKNNQNLNIFKNIKILEIHNFNNNRISKINRINRIFKTSVSRNFYHNKSFI